MYQHRKTKTGAGAKWQECTPVNSTSMKFLWGGNPSVMAPGAFGNVYKCRAQRLDAKKNVIEVTVAVKILRPTLIPQHEQEDDQAGAILRMQKRLLREVEMLEGLDHPNVAPLLGYQLGQSLHDKIIVTPWYDNGNLHQWILRSPHPLESKQSLIQGVSAAVKYLHDRNLVHGDLKPDNILISDEGRPVIIDFGLSSIAKEGHDSKSLDSRPESNRGGSNAWLSTGRVNGEHIQYSDDVYAVGCLILFILTGRYPYHHAKSDADFWRIRMANMPPSNPEALEGLDPPLPRNNPWWTVMHRCWSFDPTQPPTSRSSIPTISTIHLLITQVVADHVISPSAANFSIPTILEEDAIPPSLHPLGPSGDQSATSSPAVKQSVGASVPDLRLFKPLDLDPLPLPPFSDFSGPHVIGRASSAEPYRPNSVLVRLIFWKKSRLSLSSPNSDYSISTLGLPQVADETHHPIPLTKQQYGQHEGPSPSSSVEDSNQMERVRRRSKVSRSLLYYLSFGLIR